MRALEAFHEEEELRLALNKSLQLDGTAAQRESHGGNDVDLHPKVVRRSPDLVEELAGTHDEGTILLVADAIEEEIEGQALILRLPDEIVLEDIVGSYLDFDTIFLILPQLSKDWYKALWNAATGALLWRKLCVRAWIPLNLPMKNLVLQGAEWQKKFFTRPRIRLSGPYMTWTVFIQHPGPRTMWTPKDAPAVKVVYHYRFWWFRENNDVLYIALATRNPDQVIEMMKQELLEPGTGSNSPDVVFWKGTYHLYREETRILCDVDVPHARHGVKFTFEIVPGGSHVRALSHLSYRHKTPLDYMNHPLPEADGDRMYWYQPGFL